MRGCAGCNRGRWPRSRAWPRSAGCGRRAGGGVQLPAGRGAVDPLDARADASRSTCRCSVIFQVADQLVAGREQRRPAPGSGSAAVVRSTGRCSAAAGHSVRAMPRRPSRPARARWRVFPGGQARRPPPGPPGRSDHDHLGRAHHGAPWWGPATAPAGRRPSDGRARSATGSARGCPPTVSRGWRRAR